MGPKTVERAEKYGYPKPRLSGDYLVDLAWNTVTGVLGVGALVMHDIKVNTEKAPQHGPVIFLTSHFSLLDVVALLVADPYSNRTMYALEEAYTNVPILGGLIKSWGAVPVARDGNDVAALKTMMQALRDGRSLCIAAGGTRSRDGHLTPIDDIVAKWVLGVAEKGVMITVVENGEKKHVRTPVPIYPLVERGTAEAFPPGSKFPRRGKIDVVIGDPLDFNSALRPNISEDPLTEEQKVLIVAGIIRKSLADLLPHQNQPIDPRVMWSKRDYMGPTHYSIKDLKHKAEVRTGSIPALIEANEVYVPGDPEAEHRTTSIWRVALRREKDVKGLEHLEKAIKAYSVQEPLTIVASHVSDADTLYIEQALRGEGYGDFADLLVYLAGLNMRERRYIDINTKGGNKIYVEPPLIFEDLEAALRSNRKIPRELFQEYLRVGKHLNFEASREVVKARKRRQIIVLYPQSTRSSNGFIQKGHPDTETYLKKGIILPVMIRGSEKFMPARHIPPVWDWIIKGGKVDVEFGQPFRAKEAKTPEVLEGLKKMNANFVDLVMARIGRMDWERMDPGIRALHQKIDERFPTIPLAA